MRPNRRQLRLDQYRRIITSIAAESGDLHLDANETAMFARQLEEIDATLYRVLYPELKGTLIVPVKTDINPGAEEYTYRAMDYVGQSKVIANYADDLPRVDVQGFERTAKLFGHGASYGYSIQDLRRSRMTGTPLDQERAMAVRETILRKNDSIIASGESSLGITGFANSADVSLVTPITGNWATATGQEMVDDMLKLERAIFSDSKGAESPDSAALPPSLFALFATKKMSENSDVTALEFFLKKSLFIKNVEHWYPLETAGAGGVARIVGYRRDPSKVQALMPLEFEQQPPQQKNLAFVVNCDARVGGVIFRYPGSARYMDGC